MNILSIQSHVAFGHVGNAAATFPMQRLGHEVWPIHTVQFSNHPGHGAWTGRVFDGQAVSDVVDGLDALGVLPDCHAILSGYLGSSDTGEAVLSAVARVRAARPGALYCCDPVLGDVGRGLFVRPGIPDFMRERAVPAADILTPNGFELETLTGRAVASLDDVRDAVAGLQARGPKVVLITSLCTNDTPADRVDVAAAVDGRLWRVRTPRLPVSVNGAGDAIAALFLVRFLEFGAVRPALEAAVSSVFGILARTAEAGSREILLVAAQDEIVQPTRFFTAEEA